MPTPLSTLANGANEVNAQGQRDQGDQDGYAPAIFTLDADAGRVCVQSIVANIDGPTAAHIHRGAAGVNGPVVVNFVPLINGSTISGCTTGVSAALIEEIQANPAGFYFNVHNGQFVSGAVRGQLADASTAESHEALPIMVWNR